MYHVVSLTLCYPLQQNICSKNCSHGNSYVSILYMCTVYKYN